MQKIKSKPTDARKRVAAYARVSMETERLAHSFSAQVSYYSDFILSNAEWEYAGVYADSFVSGTRTENRKEFRRLIEDCDKGKIDIILCKSISRFARNTVDLLETIRFLKERGIEVRFEKENISSLSGDGELLLTILASFAQEESRSVSENVKWGIRRRFESGNAGARNKRVFGYRYDGEKYVIEREEAAAVRIIFEDYRNGVPLRKIAEHLTDIGVKTTRGFAFSHSQINYIVRNEIYIGNIVLQKSFVRDFITHNKVRNNGELPQYRFFDCHEPIIDRKTFELAQSEAMRRAALKPVYCFSGRLICGGCGKPFTRRSNGGKYACWHCRGCSDVKLSEDRLKAVIGLSDEEISRNILKINIRGGTLSAELTDGGTTIWQYV